MLTDAYLSYARDMSLGNINRMSEREILDAGGRSQVVADRLRDAFRTLPTYDTDTFAAHLEGMIPTYPQYSLLMESLARYREIVEAGGWERVAPRNLRAGRSHPRVAELRARLALEGFYELPAAAPAVPDVTGEATPEATPEATAEATPEPAAEMYDEALEAAVRSYQESHQMEVTGLPHNMFWGSLNVPAEQRLAQIEVTLERWRESRIGDDPYYVHVNVPDFHAEVWRDGERLARFRVVTGNNTRECDEDTNTMVYSNATPLITAEIEYLVFNPYWNVPVRIRREELDLELLENPSWLQENNYEVVVTGGTPRIRQLPGPDNALGQVKFIFPNEHNIYMHDTPSQRFFDFPIRAYSHGCVRVHEPMSFAELLLTQDGQWDPDRVDRILEAGTERTWNLDAHVPIHIEYYVVRVDEQGRTNFLADVYRYDRVRMGIDSGDPEACTVPEPEEGEPVVGSVIWNEDGSAVRPDGTVIHADGTIELAELPAEPEPEIRSITRDGPASPDGTVPPEPIDHGP